MSRRGDRLSALAWVGFGALVLVASWRMERLENQGAPPWSAPGITPGVVGALMIVFALALTWQVLRKPRGQEGSGAAAEAKAADDAPSGAQGRAQEVADDPIAEPGLAARRTALAAGLCLIFAGVSLGRGLPFQVETAAFILVFICVFSWREWRAEGRVARGVARSLLIAVVAALAISWMFESLFLVRLP